MRRVAFHLVVCVVVLITIPSGFAARRPQSGPTLYKRTLYITTQRFLRHWRTPTDKEPQYNTWCWVPKFTFQAEGPIPGGSQFVVEFYLPDGKPWLSFDCNTEEISEGGVTTIQRPNTPSDDELEKRAVVTPGVFPFKVKLKNPLAGATQDIFAGKFKVATYAPDQKIPEYRGKQEFYVQQDWRLPIGGIYLDTSSNNEKSPFVNINMWFKGTTDSTHFEGALYYAGKQVGVVNGGKTTDLETGVADPPNRYTLATFLFLTVRAHNNPEYPDSNSQLFYLDKNPGEYELRVLRDGKAARQVKFTVGPDGRVVDNGITGRNKLGGGRMVLPIRIMGDGDGKWDTAAWQTEALYGNPISGFSAL
jgi:hypothetical protein